MFLRQHGSELIMVLLKADWLGNVTYVFQKAFEDVPAIIGSHYFTSSFIEKKIVTLVTLFLRKALSKITTTEIEFKRINTIIKLHHVNI
jgi:hypothetical protein